MGIIPDKVKSANSEPETEAVPNKGDLISILIKIGLAGDRKQGGSLLTIFLALIMVLSILLAGLFIFQTEKVEQKYYYDREADVGNN